MRQHSIFEIILVVIGVIVGIVGFFFIHKQLNNDGALSWNFILSLFVWLLLLLLFIMAALLEDIKQEMKILLKDHAEEIKLLKAETAFMKEISHEQLEEVKLLRAVLKRK